MTGAQGSTGERFLEGMYILNMYLHTRQGWQNLGDTINEQPTGQDAEGLRVPPSALFDHIR